MANEYGTAFNLSGAAVNDFGVISWPGYVCDEQPTGDDRMVLPAAWADCDECDRNLIFQVWPGRTINLPWQPNGWSIVWISLGHSISAKCPEHHAMRARIELDAATFLDAYSFGADSVAEHLERVISAAIKREICIANGKTPET